MLSKKVISFLTLTALSVSLGMFAVAGSVSAAKNKTVGTDFNTVGDKILGNDNSAFDDLVMDVYNTQGEPTKIGNFVALVVNAILGLLGVIFLVLILHAGFLWMTAAGNQDQVGKAKSVLVTAIIGIIIVIGAYSISYFVINSITNATQQ